LSFTLVAVIETGAMGVLFALNLGDLIRISVATMRAGWAIQPYDGLKRCAGGSLIGEARLKVGGHGNSYDRHTTPCATFVKVIIAEP
jgi:hypothetical protein